MTSLSIINQHTNNFGDDAAGTALMQGAIAMLEVDHVDVFYLWHRNSGGIEADGAVVVDHFLQLFAGERDERPRLACSVLALALGRRPHPDLAELIDVSRRADYVLVSPAGANIGIYKDWMHLLVLTALVLSGVRPVFVQNTVGSSNSAVFDALARWVLRRSALSVRERASERWLAKRRMSTYLGVDTALLLDVTEVRKLRSECPYLAVVPTKLASWHRDFRRDDEDELWRVDLVNAVAVAARERGLGVRIVPHLYGPFSEVSVLDSLAKDLADRGVEDASVVSATTLDEYRAVLAGAMVTVSMRYHGLLLSGGSTVPCVSLAYENKMTEAAAYLGLSDLCLDVREAQADCILSLILDALDRNSEYRVRLQERIPQLREIARGPLLSLRSEQLRG